MLVSLFLVLFIIYTIIGIYSIPKWQVKSCSKINQSFKVHMRSKCKTITRNENRSLEDVTYIRLILAINHSFLEFVSFALQQLVPEGCVYKYNDRSALFLIAGLKILFLKRADSSKWSKSKNWNSISSALEKRKEKKKKTSFSFKWGTIDWRAHDSRGSFFPQIFAWMRFAWKRSTTRTLIIASRMSVDEIFISFVANLRVEKFLPSYLFLFSFYDLCKRRRSF